MKEIIIIYIPWALSILTVGMMYLAGNKNKWAWILGLANQSLWLTWIITVQAWGLLILTFALIFMYTRNLIKWHKEA